MSTTEPLPAFAFLVVNAFQSSSIDKDHARIHNYWLTAFVPPPAAPGTARPEQRAPVTGRGVDELVRVNGKWLIKSRNVAPKD